MHTPAVELNDVQFAWPHAPALLHIGHFVLARGERVFLAGASGSGKSTLLSLIAGVLQPRSGTVRILARDVGALSPGDRDRFRGDHIGFVFQNFNLLPYLSVHGNVLLPLEISASRRERLGNVSATDESMRLLHALGVGDSALLAQRADRLSIGQQQRVAAARALIGRPELLIADEPTSALDEDSRADFLKLVMAECARFGTSLLFVSHDRTLRGRFDRSVELRDINSAMAPASAA